MAKHKTAVARLHADLRPTFEGWAGPLAIGIGWDGAVYAAARRSSEPLAESRGSGVFPKSHLEHTTDYLVARWQNEDVQTVLVSAQALVVSFVQPTREGILLAGRRCHWCDDGAEQNAFTVDWTGRELTRFTLGDGIQDLRVTRNGTIWTSYFDEGVIGNYGWRNPGPSPIGSTGLVAFSSTGEVRFTYDRNAARTDAVVEAYAMNVAGDRDVWLYFYTEFPIVRIVDGRYRVWKYASRGAHALAAREDLVLMLGDDNDRSVGRRVQLRADGTTKLDGEVEIIDDQGAALPRTHACGVGDKLYFFDDRRVLVFDEW